MKQIIDIPDEVLESKQYCQYFGVCSDKLIETIESGTSYVEPKEGGCISREALKKELNSRPFPQDYSTTLLLGTFNELIDNAPTVEPARPQGKWKTVDGYDGNEYYECSNCGEPWVLYAGTPEENNMNFCPNCGADLRKGGAE